MAVNEGQPNARLARELLRNSALMVLGRAAGVLSLVVAVPFIVAHLGTTGYGVWESMLAVAGAALIFQLAISGTVLWRVSTSYGSQDPDESARIVRIGIGATVALTAVFFPLVWISSEALMAGLQVPDRWAAEARWLLPSVVAIMLLGGVNQTLSAVVTGYQRAGLAALIQSGGLVVTHLTTILLLLAGYGLQSLLLGLIAGFVAAFAALYPTASALCGRISLLPSMPSRKDLAVLGPFAGLLLISNLSFLLRDNTDKIVLASLASPAMTGYFGMAQRLAALVMQSFAVVSVPLTAAVGALWARGDWPAIRGLYEKVGSWVAIAAGLAGFSIWTLRKALFVLWLGQDYPEAHAFLLFVLFGVTSAIIFGGVGVALAKGIGRPGLETTYTLVTLGLTLLSKPVLIFLFGPLGSVASSAACWSLGAAFLLLLVHRRLELPSQMIRRTVGVFAVTIALSVLGWKMGEFVATPQGRPEAGLTLVVLGPLCALVYLGVVAALGLARLPGSKQPLTDTVGRKPDQ